MPRQLASARRHYRLSSLIAKRAGREAKKAAARGVGAVATVVASHQAAQAISSQTATAAMLSEQAIDQAAEALLNSLAFTTSVDLFSDMLDSAGGLESPNFTRLIESLVQDAGRAAESVATTVRPNIAHVRYLSPPSCSRCAVLAGRVYRYSEGFRRHPNCDCVMIPTTVASRDLVQEPAELLRKGLLTGLSKADARALAAGADFNQIVNVRGTRAGLLDSGRVLARRGRLTPEGIYARTNTREQAVAALRANGYLLP